MEAFVSLTSNASSIISRGNLYPQSQLKEHLGNVTFVVAQNTTLGGCGQT